MDAQPSERILDAFGVKGLPILLEGGEGTTYQAGGFIFKPAENIEEANWRAELMNSIVEDGFRVPHPVKSKNNKWIESGWCVYTFLEGKEVTNRWEEKINVSRKFNKSLANAAKPDFIDKASHPWAIADKMIWGFLPMQYGEILKPAMIRLESLIRPINLKNQLIHGDMTSNILFHNTLPPAVIDLSPYWHPAQYAEAIIVVDSIVWDDAPDTIIKELDNTFETYQLLLRAAMWRIKTTEEFASQYSKGDINNIDVYNHVIDLISRLLN